MSDANASDDRKPVKPIFSVHPGFEEFYANYPRHEAKADAAKAWAKEKPDLELLLCDIANRLTVGHWSDPKFIPLPATYLRGHRWEDSVRPRVELSTQAKAAQVRRDHNARVLGVQT